MYVISHLSAGLPAKRWLHCGSFRSSRLAKKEGNKEVDARCYLLQARVADYLVYTKVYGVGLNNGDDTKQKFEVLSKRMRRVQWGVGDGYKCTLQPPTLLVLLLFSFSMPIHTVLQPLTRTT